MTKEDLLFPNQLTTFTTKRDASYDGDPEGDYILAEHVNSLQEAIQRIEGVIGLHASDRGTISQNIHNLEEDRPMRVDSVGYFSENLNGNENSIRETLGQYDMVILSIENNTTKELIAHLQEKGTVVYGEVDGRAPLASVQNNIHSWKEEGVRGVFINAFGEEENPTRSHQQDLIDSVHQEGLGIIISGGRLSTLLDDRASEPYNPAGVPFNFSGETIVQVNPFAYNQGYQNIDQLMQSTYPLIQSLKQKGVKLIGWSAGTTQKHFEYIQASALIFSLDYLYNGNPTGESLSNRSPLFNWPSLFSRWQTDLPIVFNEGNSLVRRVNNGSIRVYDDYSVELSGLEVPSTLIQWVQNSVPGSVLKDQSIHPDKLSTYDIRRIVDLLNDSSEEIRIRTDKIEIDETGGGLPGSIPANNMMAHVIEAVNRKANPNSTETAQIADASIQSLSSEKLTGHVSAEQLVSEVVSAINEASSNENYINIPRARIVNLTSTGQIDGNEFLGDSISVRQGNITESLTVPSLTVNEYLTGLDGEFENLQIQRLEVSQITGLENLDLTTLTTDNMEALVAKIVELEADNAQIGRLVAGNIEAGQVSTELITALNAITDTQITNTGLFGTGVIQDAHIHQLDAGKIASGTIDTDEVTLSSKEGHLRIESDNLRIYDHLDNDGERRVRIALGQVGDLLTVDEITLEQLIEQRGLKEKEWKVAEGAAADDLQEEIEDLTIEISTLIETIDNHPDDYKEDLYGLVIYGEDGTTRLFDNTGVYNAGIKNNAITNDKLEAEAIDDRVIRAGSITARSIQAETITGDLIAGETIAGSHIIGETITGAHILGETIKAGHLASGSITTEKLQSAIIEAEHIKSRAVTSEKLTIGFNVNQMPFGFDSFEQEPLGSLQGNKRGNAQADITSTWSYEGNKSLVVYGNSPENIVELNKESNRHPIVLAGDDYILSLYARSESASNVPIRIGLLLEDGSELWSDLINVQPGSMPRRLFSQFEIPENITKGSVLLSVNATNIRVYFDAIQLEEANEGITEPGPFRATATTTISGDSITTGRIDASRIQVGSGTIFGDGDIITITDEGITARSENGTASLNSEGLVIEGGAFRLNGGVGEQSIRIDGQKGITAENAQNRIDINANRGLAIINKSTDEIILDIDPTTGNLRFSGTARFYSKGNPEMSWSIGEKIDELDQDNEENKQAIDKSIQLMEERYAISTSLTTPPPADAEWSLVPPTPKDDEYIWRQTTTTLNDGTSVTSAPISITGAKGESVYTLDLSNNHQGIPTDAFGQNGDYTFAKTTLSVFQGTRDITEEVEIEATPTPGITGVWEGNIYKVTDLTTDAGEVEFRVQIGDVSLVKFFGLTKSKQGNDATAYELMTGHQVLVKESSGLIVPSEITLTSSARSLGQGSRSEPVYFKIYERAENPVTIDEYTDLEASGLILPDREYIISDMEHPYVLRYTSDKLEASHVYRPNLNILSIHIEIYRDANFLELLDNQTIAIVSEGHDGEDAYHTEIMSVNGNMFKNGVVDTWLYAIVYKGREDVTAQINANRFRWERTSNDPASDALWNEKYASGVKEIKITTDDIYKQATFTCKIYEK